MFPNDSLQEPFLCTYYVIMSLLVVYLAVKLVWYPFIQLIVEVNTIITRLVIYIHTNVFGYSDPILFNSLESAFLSDKTISVITILCAGFVLYLALDDIKNFASCYLANFPSNEAIVKAKKLAFDFIEDLLNVTGNGGVPRLSKKMKPRRKIPTPPKPEVIDTGVGS